MSGAGWHVSVRRIRRVVAHLLRLRCPPQTAVTFPMTRIVASSLRHVRNSSFLCMRHPAVAAEVQPGFPLPGNGTFFTSFRSASRRHGLQSPSAIDGVSGRESRAQEAALQPPPVAFSGGFQRRWSRTSSLRVSGAVEGKKSSGVRVRKQRQQQHTTPPDGGQGDQQQQLAPGASPPQPQQSNQVAAAPNPSAPATQSKGGGMMGVIAEGMMHGVGWAFGQRAVDALMGPRTMEVVHTDSSGGGTSEAGAAPPAGGSSHDASGVPPPSSASPPEPSDTNAYGPEGWQWGDDQSSHGGGGMFGGDDEGGGWFGGGDGDW